MSRKLNLLSIFWGFALSNYYKINGLALDYKVKISIGLYMYAAEMIAYLPKDWTGQEMRSSLW